MTRKWLGVLAAYAGISAVQAETLDIMVLFNESARSQVSDVDTWATHAVEFYNQALDNADINMQGRLVHAGSAPSAYNKTMTGNTELNEMIADGQISSLRDQYGADVVALVTGSAANWCGYGKIIQGDSSTGQIYSGQSERAVFWSKVSCGNKTFSHEVGHSMGLGHSYEQGSSGGMYKWARGHGKNSQWVTMMAYTGAYNAPSGNRLQVFSNPQVTFCQGSACGKDRNLTDGADAAGYIEQVADQLMAFRPAVDNNPNLPPDPCAPLNVSGNLVTNPEMNSTASWAAFPDSSSLGISVFEQVENNCSEKRLLTSQRSSSEAGISQNMTGKLSASKRYKLSATGKLFLSGREDLKASFQLGGNRVQALKTISITNSEMSLLEAEFVPELNSDQEALKLVFNLSSNSDFILDKVSVVYLGDVTTEPPPEPGIPEWDKNTIYAKPGNKVQYQGKVYQNKWWTKGDIPGTQKWGPWEEI